MKQLILCFCLVITLILSANYSFARTITTTTTTKDIDENGKEITKIVVEETKTTNDTDDLYHRNQSKDGRVIDPSIAITAGSAAAIGGVIYNNRRHRHYRRWR